MSHLVHYLKYFEVMMYENTKHLFCQRGGEGRRNENVNEIIYNWTEMELTFAWYTHSMTYFKNINSLWSIRLIHKLNELKIELYSEKYSNSALLFFCLGTVYSGIFSKELCSLFCAETIGLENKGKQKRIRKCSIEGRVLKNLC